MTMTDALGRIEQIQTTLLRMADPKPPVIATDTKTAGAFAEALANVGTVGIPDAGVTNPGGASGTDVVAAAKKYLGVPYVFGGEDSSGMDCSGLVQRVYADLGIEVPRLVSGQMTIGTEVGSLAEAQPGDLIVTAGGDHILIYAGDNKVIHAPYEGRTVSLVNAYMTDADIVTIRRVIPEGSTAASTAARMSSILGGTGLGGSALGGSGFGGSGFGNLGASSDVLTAALARFNGGVAR
ncbi:C40 family peptidase [Glaciibacter superstes]|uniref:C40 family peptidase n=1 Tax=Glaciibacter superstes TaxID=501023 RepID=UPI0003F820A6|nr:C40 family peptidase [Glaciibacter superstes]